MIDDIVTIARASYDAYVTKDRAAIEALIAHDFHFTNPLDNRIDRATYFARCWPNSATTEAFNFAHLVAAANAYSCTYEGRTTDGQRFRSLVTKTVVRDLRGGSLSCCLRQQPITQHFLRDGSGQP